MPRIGNLTSCLALALAAALAGCGDDGGGDGAPAPTVTSVSPNNGLSSGNTSITVTGTGYQAGATVSFGGTAATSVTVDSATQITCTTPAHAPGVVNVVVRNPDSQTGTLGGGYTFLAAPAPTVASVNPPSGPTAGSTAVTIIGTNFQSAATVDFGGAAATGISVVSATEIACTTSAHAGGAVIVTVTNPDTQSGGLADGFTYVPAPGIGSVSPTSGASAGGTAVTVTGTAFQNGATVSFGGVAATNVVFVSATEITCTTDIRAVGAVDVVVTNPDTQTDTLPGGFSYLTTWTIFVYGHADHNLSTSLIADIQEMNNATLGDHTRVVVVADYSSGRTNPNTGFPFPAGTEWYGINGGGQAETLIGTDVEFNFDDPAVLQATVQMVATSFPADRYGIVLWDHGGSWDGGFGHDEQDTPGVPADDGSGMSAAQAATAITNGLAAAGVTGLRPLEFVAFDTCLMCGNEVAYEFRNLAKTYIACAEIDFGAGWDYQATLTYIDANPAASATAIAAQEVSHWDVHHATNGASDREVRAHAALDLTQMDAFVTAWADLTLTMTASSGLDWMEVGRKQFVSVPGYSIQVEKPDDYPNIRDTGLFLDELVTITSDVDVPVDAANARTALNTLILSASLGDLRSAQGQAGVHCELPLALAWPARRAAYLGLAWDTVTGWSGALDALQTNSDAVAPVVNTVAINTTDPDAANPPTVTLWSDDADVAEAQVLLAETIAANVILYGLIGEGLVAPTVGYQFAWDGNLFGLDDGVSISEVFLGRWINAGANSIYVIPGTLSNGTETYDAYAIYEDGNATISDLFVDFQGQTATVPMSHVKGWQFTPVLYNLTTASWMPITPLTIPNIATPSLTFFAASAAPGTYHILTMMTDVWGNAGAEVDDVTVITPFGD